MVIVCRPLYSVINERPSLPVAQCVSVNVCKHHLAIRVGLGSCLHRVSELNRTSVCGSCCSCWLTLSLAYVFTFVNKFWIILFVAPRLCVGAVCLVDV